MDPPERSHTQTTDEHDERREAVRVTTTKERWATETLPGSGPESEEDVSAHSPSTSPPQRPKKYYICDSQLLEKILQHVNLDDLLCCRLVCHNWYKIIGETGLLWQKGRMILTRCRIGTGDVHSYANTDLFKRFQCPNFSFYGSDLREDPFRNFFIIHGLRLKHIVVRNCFISKATFDLILLQCPNVEHLDINCVSRTVSLCEMLFPRDLNVGLNLSKLRTLLLKRLDSYSAEDIAAGPGGSVYSKLLPPPADPMNENLDGENLSPTLVEQLLETCANLEEVTLAGWHGPTIYNLVNFLNSRPQFSKLRGVHLTEIGGRLDESFFFPLCTKTKHLKITRLSISLKDPVVFVTPADLKRSQMLDSVMELVLEAQRESLNVLSFVNLPVTAGVFKGKFPKLISLKLLNTWVDDVDRLIGLMPKLTTIDYHAMARKTKKPPGPKGASSSYSFGNFCQCSTMDLICLVAFVVVVFIMILIALVFHFETYGQWFITVGFIILAAVCLADFLQQYHPPSAENEF